MQILHFNWLLYSRTISNGHRVAKFFRFILKKIFLQFAFAKFIIAFNVRLLALDDTKKIKPFVIKDHGPIAHSA